jgi:hypothetical protein
MPPAPPPPPAVNQPPSVSWQNQPSGTIAQSGEGCGGGERTVGAVVTVTDDTPGASLRVVLHWSGFDNDSAGMSQSGTTWSGAVGPVAFSGQANQGGDLSVWVTASDGTSTTTLPGPSVNVAPCPPNAG